MTERDFTSGANRARWAIEHSGKTLEAIAALIGCTHATLSQWQTGTTDLMRSKAGLVTAFARVVNVNVQWLLTGDGAVRSNYASTEHPLITEARHIVQEAPALAEQAYRVLVALEAKPPH